MATIINANETKINLETKRRILGIKRGLTKQKRHLHFIMPQGNAAAVLETPPVWRLIIAGVSFYKVPILFFCSSVIAARWVAPAAFIFLFGDASKPVQ